MNKQDKLSNQRNNTMKIVTLTIVLLMAGGLHTYAQDVITLKNGEEINAKVTEVSSSEIRYKRFDHLDGPTVVLEKAKVFAINYENGTREVINTVSETPTVKAETPAPQTTTIEPSGEKKWAKPNIGIFFNPSGFLAFGPMLGAEFSAGMFDIEANVFFPQAGLLLNYIITEGYEHTKNGGIGFLIAPKFYMNRAKGGFYAGALVGYWKIREIVYSDGYSTPGGVVAGTNIGYKFVLPFGLYFRTGAYLGANINTNWYWYSNSYYGGVEDYSGNVTIFACLDLTIGFNFLKVKR